MNPPEAPSVLRRAHALLPAVVLALAFGCNFIGRGIAETWAVFLLPIEDEFGLVRSQVTSVYSIYLVVAGLAAPFSGMAFDRFGPRFCYLLGMSLVAGGVLAAGWAQAPWHFVLANGLVVGVGAALIGMVPASVMLSRWFRAGLGRAIALAYAGFGTGILLLVPLSQALIDRLGWRSAYETLGIGLAVVAGALLFVPWRRIAAGSPELVQRMAEPRPGSAAAAEPGPAAAGERAADRQSAGARLAMTRAQAATRSGPPSHDAADPATPATPATPASAPLSLAQAIRTPAFRDLVITFHMTAVGMYLIIPQVVVFLVETGYPPLLAASLFGLAGSLSMGGILTAGWLSDTVGFRFAATLSYVCTLAGTASLAMLVGGPSTIWLSGFVLLFGLAQGARGPIVSTLSNRIFAGPSAGTIYGVIFALMSIGSAIGAWASGWLHDLTGGYTVGFILSATCIVIAMAPFWWSRRFVDVVAH